MNEGVKTQIVAVFRLAEYVSGEVTGKVDDDITIIWKAEWVDVQTLNIESDFIEDEIEIIRKVL